ncbi:YggS family pyridoxal phosphate-dependent enzyme [Flavobacteriaceae bacterium]|jgi:pyridoxal phosphate enzyme (YggS family)|nr:YggS family pyridoxal phosphate-dependent enzyme [Flavobacteriaceae bacterium]
MDIHSNIKELIKNLPSEVTLVAVSKTKSNEEIMQAYEAGQRVFGENKIQEMAAKWEALPKDIVWHMIGHVQTNKVKYMAHFVDLIHGVESLKLLKEINKQAVKHNRVISCLIQIRIAEEETKFGLPADELESLLLSAQSFSNIKIAGLMGMASFTDNIEQIKNEFFQLKTIFDKTQNQLPECTILSMGMSGDYPLAIQAGSTMIRVGSKIFGQRNY